jgi:hypothetical protein
MQSNKLKIKIWAESRPSRPLVLVQDVGEKIGYGVVRNTGELKEMSLVRVVVKCERYNGMPYFILASYILK